MKSKTSLFTHKNSYQRFMKRSAATAMIGASALLMIESSVMAAPFTSNPDATAMPEEGINVAGLQEANHPKTMLPKLSYQEEVVAGIVAAATLAGGMTYAYRNGYLGRTELRATESREALASRNNLGEFREGPGTGASYDKLKARDADGVTVLQEESGAGAATPTTTWAEWLEKKNCFTAPSTTELADNGSSAAAVRTWREYFDQLNCFRRASGEPELTPEGHALVMTKALTGAIDQSELPGEQKIFLKNEVAKNPQIFLKNLIELQNFSAALEDSSQSPVSFWSSNVLSPVAEKSSDEEESSGAEEVKISEALNLSENQSLEVVDDTAGITAVASLGQGAPTSLNVTSQENPEEEKASL